MTETLYKVLGPKGEAIHGGSATWALPNGKPGKWMPKIADPVCCEQGYHLVELPALAEWLRDDCTIYLAEGKGPSDSDGTGKTAFSEARLLRRLYISERDLRLFAADCAEHVLPIWLAKYPKDDRPAKAIEAARAFARGEITRSAAWSAESAAWSAAGSAAGPAAGSAAWSAAGSAVSSAESAARSAAWSAAESAAWSAAWSAERQWQSTQLVKYLKDAP